MQQQGPQHVESMVGQVVREEYGRGSKSERAAVFLEAASGRYLLRRKAGPAFGDAQIDACVGHRVECAGFLLGTTFLAETIRVIE
ncbi:MAG TPA: hypothetical protein VF816_16845 [Rhodocyclaceae bacterium]